MYIIVKLLITLFIWAYKQNDKIKQNGNTLRAA